MLKLFRQLVCRNLLPQHYIEAKVHLLKSPNELRNGITQVTTNRKVVKIFRLTISQYHLPGP